MTSYRQIVTSLSFFRFIANLEQSRSRIPDGWSVVLTLLLKLTFYDIKNEYRTKKNSNTALILLLSVKILFLPKDFFAKQMLVSSKLFCNNICVYLPTTFQVSSIILTSFRQGALYTPLPPTANKSRKSPPRRGLKNCKTYLYQFRKDLKLFRISYHQHNFLYVLSNIVFYM